MKTLNTDADLHLGHDTKPVGEKAPHHVDESPEPPVFQDAQSNQYTPAPTQVETPMTPMADDKATRSLGPVLDAVVFQSKVKSFLEGFETAKPFLESNLTLAEIETVLVDGGFSESEQKTTIEFLQTYRRGQSKLQELRGHLTWMKESGAGPSEMLPLESEIAILSGKPEEPADLDKGKGSGKPTDLPDDKGKGGPSKEYWQLLAIFIDMQQTNSKGDTETMQYRCFCFPRLYRYVQPRANGSFKCSEDVLKMYRSPDGRPLPKTVWNWVILHCLFSCLHAFRFILGERLLGMLREGGSVTQMEVLVKKWHKVISEKNKGGRWITKLQLMEEYNYTE